MKKKTMGILIAVIMIMPVLSFLIPGEKPQQFTNRTIVSRVNVSSIKDALQVSPPGVVYAIFVSTRGIEGTFMGEDLETWLSALSLMYGAKVYSRYVAMTQDIWFELHDVGESRINLAPRGIYTYGSYSILEIYLQNATWPWIGIVPSTSPMILGLLSPQVSPPYIIGLDRILDLMEGRSKNSSYTEFDDLISLSQETGNLEIVRKNPYNWSDKVYVSVSHVAGESYRLQMIFNATSNFTQEVDALENQTGMNFTTQAIDHHVILTAFGDWTEIYTALSRSGLMR